MNTAIYTILALNIILVITFAYTSYLINKYVYRKPKSFYITVLVLHEKLVKFKMEKTHTLFYKKIEEDPVEFIDKLNKKGQEKQLDKKTYFLVNSKSL